MVHTLPFGPLICIDWINFYLQNLSDMEPDLVLSALNLFLTIHYFLAYSIVGDDRIK